MSKEAMKLALDVLKTLVDRFDYEQFTSVCELDDAKDSINALEEALAKQEQSAQHVGDPVANALTWFALVMNAAAELENASIFLRDEDAKRVAISGAKYYRDKANTLYTTPQPKQEQGEPVAEVKENPFCPEGHSDELTTYLPVGMKLYTTPQQHKPLTFEQVEACFQDGGIWGVDGKHLGTTAQGLHDFARSIEAAHGIKE